MSQWTKEHVRKLSKHGKDAAANALSRSGCGLHSFSCLYLRFPPLGSGFRHFSYKTNGKRSFLPSILGSFLEPFWPSFWSLFGTFLGPQNGPSNGFPNAYECDILSRKLMFFLRSLVFRRKHSFFFALFSRGICNVGVIRQVSLKTAGISTASYSHMLLFSYSRLLSSRILVFSSSRLPRFSYSLIPAPGLPGHVCCQIL